jgi:hypothetical protein
MLGDFRFFVRIVSSGFWGRFKELSQFIFFSIPILKIAPIFRI